MNRRAIWPLVLLGGMLPPCARATEPTPTVRDQIEAFFRPQLFLPETADWHYDFSKPFLGGTLWCGKVDYMNSVKKYVGERGFYVTVFNDGVHQGAILAGPADDPAGSIATKLHMLCGY